MNRPALLGLAPLLLAVAGLTASGCGKKDPAASTPLPGAAKIPGATPPSQALAGAVEVTPANQATLMPFTEGSTWTYEIEISQQRTGTAPQQSVGNVTYKIDAAKKRGDRTEFLLGIYEDGKKKDEQMWYVSDKGIYQMSLGSARRAFDPPQPITTFPVKVGETFKWNGTSRGVSGRTVSSVLEGEVIGAQTVDSDMGPIGAMLVETTTVSDTFATNGRKVKAATITDTWFRPGVGIVRYRQTTRAIGGAAVYTLRLKSYKIN